MSEVANSVWTTAKRKLGFYGALAAFGGGVYLVYSALNPAVKYVEGPLGRKTHVQVSEPFIEGSNTTRYTVSGFLTRLETSEASTNFPTVGKTTFVAQSSITKTDTPSQTEIPCSKQSTCASSGV